VNQSRHAVLLEELERLAANVVGDAGLELVEMSLRGSSKKRVLRLDIDREGPDGVGLEDCQRVSKHIGSALEEAGLLRDSYVLEVSSPGIDRPIRTDDDIRRNAGRRVQIETTEPIEGRKVFAGVLVGGEADWLELRIDDQEVLKIPRNRIQMACQEASFQNK
jgi:ribosome maturation factor RimP